MKKNLVLFIFIAVLIISCPDESKDDSQAIQAVPKDVIIPVDIMGMCHAGSKDNIDEEYALIDEMGFVWMQRDFNWSYVNPAQDTWVWERYDRYVANAKARGKKIFGLLLYDVGWIHGALDPQTQVHVCGHTRTQTRSGIVSGKAEVEAFCQYAARTVERYKDTVDAWCIWNEPNLGDRFWGGTPDEFFTLTKKAAAAVREVAPNAVLLGGAFNTIADNDIWTKGIFESGAMDQIDYLAYHPYMPDAVTSGRAYNSFRDYASKYNFQDKIWVTEVGYPLDMGPGGYDTKVKEEDMPEMTVKTITLLAAEGARVIVWYEMYDHGAAGNPDDSEHWFGLVDDDTLIKKVGGEAYQICAKNIPGKTLRPSVLKQSGLPDYIAAYYFESSDSDGKHSLVIWNNRQSRPQQIKVTLPGENRKLWDVSTGASVSIEETTEWTLKTRDGENKPLQFFTW